MGVVVIMEVEGRVVVGPTVVSGSVTEFGNAELAGNVAVVASVDREAKVNMSVLVAVVVSEG